MRNIALALAVALSSVGTGAAHAAMGGQTIMDRVDADSDHKLSLAEARAAAGRRYDLIKSKNGGRVTMLQLGGRLVPADLKFAGLAASLTTPVSRENYLSLVDHFFDEARTDRKAGDPPGSGSLVVDSLSSPAGKKLVGLLE